MEVPAHAIMPTHRFSPLAEPLGPASTDGIRIEAAVFLVLKQPTRDAIEVVELAPAGFGKLGAYRG
jgi:hypothetical protein